VIQHRTAQYMAAFLIMEGVMVGVFASLDAMLFYVFWEAMLIPMFLIIGVWGGPNRVYATIKFFLYTFFGSVFMLVALNYMYFQSGNFEILGYHDLKLDLTEQVDVDVEGAVYADGGRLRQILRNLVGNALRYGGSQIKVTTRIQDEVVCISVSDSGDGIPADLETHVFEPFVTAGREEGLPASVGLGLTISRRLAALMGGALTYRRVEGWSTLDLQLPAAAMADVELSA